MRQKWNRLVYIDLFAGPGVCRVRKTGEEVPGSPLLALQAKYRFTDCFFNDYNADFIEALKQRTAPYGGSNLAFLNKDCNEAARAVAEAIPENSLCLTFVDSYNWQITFDSLAALTRDRRMDLLITFHCGHMKRVAHSPPPALHDFFGDSTWHDKYQQSIRAGKRQGTRILLDCYTSRLREIGYRHIDDNVGVRNEHRTRLYHLILATKHQRGRDFWDKVSGRSIDGQAKLF